MKTGDTTWSWGEGGIEAALGRGHALAHPEPEWASIIVALLTFAVAKQLKRKLERKERRSRK